ncbi:hypothetical protein [Desulfocurvus sp. DL9XJH121]
MEISGIYGMGRGVSLTMTEDQKSTVEEILAKYDPENMTREDMEALRMELEEAGIGRSRELMKMMQEAGFKPPEKPKQPMEEDTRYGVQKGELWDLYQQLQSGEVSEEEFLEQIRNQMPGSLVDCVS